MSHIKLLGGIIVVVLGVVEVTPRALPKGSLSNLVQLVTRLPISDTQYWAIEVATNKARRIE